MLDVLLSGFALFLVLFCIGATVLLAVRLWTVLRFGGAPFVASSRDSISRAISLADIREGSRVADLGSGDGVMLFALADTPASRVVGYEIDPLLVYQSRRGARRKRLDARVEIIQGDFWNADLSAFDVVFVFQIPYAMPRLEEKLRNELKPGSRVISNTFRFPDWEPASKDGQILLYVT